MRFSFKTIFGSTLVLGLVFTLSSCKGNSAFSGKGAADSSAVQADKIIFKDMYRNPYASYHLSRQQYRGKLIYDHYCAVCHGENGDGNGFNSFNLQNSFGIRPFNFTDSSAVRKLKVDEIKKAIEAGGTAVGKSQYMPPWGKTLLPDEISALTQYIQTFMPAL